MRTRGLTQRLVGRFGGSVGPTARTLSGDRDLEWTYVAARLGRYVSPGKSVLDFGCGSGFISYTAAGLGAKVLAIDLMPRQFGAHPGVEFRQMDVVELSSGEKRFDFIVNCSTIEHVGLAGRYNSKDVKDGDLLAMAYLRTLLTTDGRMALTLPVGRDSVFHPLHRVYGRQRLPRLLNGYEVLEETYWWKTQDDLWEVCTREEALDDIPSEHYYGLGMMVLKSIVL